MEETKTVNHVDWMAKCLAEREARKNERKERMYTTLAKHPQIATITAFYNGSGDEGYVEDCDYLSEDEQQVVLTEEAVNELDEVVERYVGDALPGGWEINEGSNGSVSINVKERKATFDHTYLVERTEELTDG